MKHVVLFLVFAWAAALHAQSPSADAETPVDSAAQMAAYLAYADSVERSLPYQRQGDVQLADGKIKLTIPTGFRYLPPAASRYVLETLWENPPDSSTLGMLFYEGNSPFSGYAYNISYEEIGYVSDEDADDIDYTELLTDMQESTREESKERMAQGYQGIELVGWAANPFYDKERHILHWAKDLRFFTTSDTASSLNYNLRLLGRKGVLQLNAIGTSEHLSAVKGHSNALAQNVSFTEGNRYADFDSDLDEVAAVGIGGLIAGKVLTKVGFWAVLAKFGKLIFVGVAAALGAVWRFVTGRRKTEVPFTAPVAAAAAPPPSGDDGTGPATTEGEHAISADSHSDQPPPQV